METPDKASDAAVVKDRRVFITETPEAVRPRLVGHAEFADRAGWSGWIFPACGDGQKEVLND
jgi:hypothetical protein